MEACVMYNLDLKLQQLIGYEVSMLCDLIVPDWVMHDDSELEDPVLCQLIINNLRGKHKFHEIKQSNLVKTASRRFMCVCLVPEAGGHELQSFTC